MKRNIILAIFVISLSSCARSCNSLDREFQTSDRNYEIEVFSGGKLINTYKFKGILNNQKSSDGYYWYENDTLKEVSGTVIIKSFK